MCAEAPKPWFLFPSAPGYSCGYEYRGGLSPAPYSSTREFADLDGVGMALEAEATQALPGILVGQVEDLLQVIGGRLVHAQLLRILLVEEANFLPQRTGHG